MLLVFLSCFSAVVHFCFYIPQEIMLCIFIPYACKSFSKSFLSFHPDHAELSIQEHQQLLHSVVKQGKYGVSVTVSVSIQKQIYSHSNRQAILVCVDSLQSTVYIQQSTVYRSKLQVLLKLKPLHLTLGIVCLFLWLHLLHPPEPMQSNCY